MSPFTPTIENDYRRKRFRVFIGNEELEFFASSTRSAFRSGRLGLVVKMHGAANLEYQACQCCVEMSAWQAAPLELRAILAPTLAAGHNEHGSWCVQQLIAGRGGRPSRHEVDRIVTRIEKIVGFYPFDLFPEQFVMNTDDRPVLVDYGFLHPLAETRCDVVCEQVCSLDVAA